VLIRVLFLEEGSSLQLRAESSRRLLGGIVLATIAAAVVWLVATSQIGGLDFGNNLWAPSHLLLRGESPYDLSSLEDFGNPVWLPMAIGALLPLGALPLPQAAMVWLLASLGIMVGIVWIVSEQKRPSLLPFSAGLVAIALYPPTMTHLQLGQFSLLAALLYLLSLKLVQQRRIGWAALPVALALAKPQLGILAVMGLTIMIYRQDKARGAGRFLLAVGGWCLLLILPLVLLYPGWAPDFLLALDRNPAWLQPSLFRLLPLWLGWWGWLVWGLLLVLVVGINGRIWWQRPGLVAMCWSLALTPLVSPYIWSWDFVLMLPLFIWGIFHWQRRATRGLLLVAYLANWILMVWLALLMDPLDHLFWWGSWLLVSVMVIAWGWERRSLPETQTA
jgi:hypothetical protein